MAESRIRSDGSVHGWLAQAGPFAPLLLMGLMATAVVVAPHEVWGVAVHARTLG
jgi:hypothetical protein